MHQGVRRWRKAAVVQAQRGSQASRFCLYKSLTINSLDRSKVLVSHFHQRLHGPNDVSAIMKLLEKCRPRHGLYAACSDWCQCAAISLNNAVDLQERNEREKQYLEVVRRYDPAMLQVFPEILGAVVMALEEKPTDILGQVFHVLELHNTARGQFFTPYAICEMMAKINIGSGDDVAAKLKRRGYIRAQEPACGSGAMVIALAEATKDVGHNYQEWILIAVRFTWPIFSLHSFIFPL